MARKTLARIMGTSFVVSTFFALFLYCLNPQNPFTDPHYVTIDLILPDTGSAIIYTIDTTRITIVTTLTSLVESVELSIGVIKDTLLQTLSDTMQVTFVFQDTGSVTITAKAYCKQGITKECQKDLRVYKNPLVPPDTVFTQPLSDTSIKLYWRKTGVEKSYNVYRSLSDTGAFSLVQTVTNSLCIDTALSAATTYYYTVSSLDSLDRESGLSSIYAATTFPAPLSRWDEMKWDQNKWE
ncbi:MAG: hypothetical protein JXA71_13045 [Chitinispirillaceae bacterium]|nr:hypothetical protein [Chitinispirillaceae bacterium]